MPVPAVINEALTFGIYLTSQADTDILQVNPTIDLVGGDIQVSTDGAAFQNVAAAAVTPAGGRRVEITLSAAQMNGDVISWVASDQAGDEWQDLAGEIRTDSQQIGDLAATGADGDTLETLSDQIDLTALEGADGDTLETLSDQLDGVCTLGVGAITWAYTLTSDVAPNPPIADADAWVTTDLAGTNVVASGRTNAAGVVTFFLDAGTVYVWRQKSGWDFDNPDSEVVV